MQHRSFSLNMPHCSSLYILLCWIVYSSKVIHKIFMVECDSNLRLPFSLSSYSRRYRWWRIKIECAYFAGSIEDERNINSSNATHIFCVKEPVWTRDWCSNSCCLVLHFQANPYKESLRSPTACSSMICFNVGWTYSFYRWVFYNLAGQYSQSVASKSTSINEYRETFSRTR